MTGQTRALLSKFTSPESGQQTFTLDEAQVIESSFDSIVNEYKNNNNKMDYKFVVTILGVPPELPQTTDLDEFQQHFYDVKEYFNKTKNIEALIKCELQL